MSETTASSVTSAWAPLRHRLFFWLWVTQLASNIGVWMQTVGAQWFLVEQTGSPALVAWVQTASMLPALFLSLLAGVLADQFDRRWLLILSNAAAMLLAGVLSLMTYTHTLTPSSLLVITFLIGATATLTGPAWQAIQPELVPRSELASASALGGVAVNAARAVGPALAGFLVALTGPALVFLLNAVSFVLVIVALSVWRRPPRPEGTGRERWRDALTSGVRYVVNGPVVRRLLLRSALFAFPASALWALLPQAASELLGVGSTGYGILLGALGVGALLGVAVLPGLRARFGANLILAGSALLFAVGAVTSALTGFVVVLPLLMLTGMAWIGSLTTLNAGMQLSVAAWVRARAMSVYLLVFMGSQAIGSFLWGAVSESIGTRATLIASAVALMLTALSVVVLPLHAATGTLDRTPISLCVSEPTLVFEPTPSDGPVLVVRTYMVPGERADDFRVAMHLVEQSLRRTGATSWRLYLSGERPDEFREEFTVRSWSEYQRQHRDRLTGSDQERYEQAVRLATAEPRQEHFVAASTRP